MSRRLRFSLKGLFAFPLALARWVRQCYRDAVEFRRSMKGLVRYLKDQENR